MDEQNNTQPTQGTPAAETGVSTPMLMGGLAALALVIIGSWYLMQGSATPPEVATNTTQEMPMMATGTTDEAATAQATAALRTQSSSDELDAIDADISATNMSSLGDPSKI